MGNKEIEPSGWNYLRDDIQTHILFITLFLFFLIILVGFLLYHFFCQELRSPAAYTDRSTTVFGVRLQTQIRRKPAPVGLDSITINSLPVLIHRSSSSGSETDFEQSECSICLGIFQDKEIVKILPICRHAFHCVCVDNWLRNRSTCPVCREAIVSGTGTETA